MQHPWTYRVMHAYVCIHVHDLITIPGLTPLFREGTARFTRLSLCYSSLVLLQNHSTVCVVMSTTAIIMTYATIPVNIEHVSLPVVYNPGNICCYRLQ